MSDERDDSLTGTEGQEHQDGNAAETQTAGTGADGAQGGNDETDEIERLRQEKAELERQKGQWLAEKNTVDAIKAENERLKQSTQAVDRDAQEYDKAQQRYAALADAARQGDPYAAAILDQARINMEIRHQQMVDKQLAAIPEGKRDEVRRLYEGGGFENPLKIWDVMKPAYDEAQQKVAQRTRRDDEAAAHNRSRADTSTRTLGPAETKQKLMTYAEYNQLQDEATRDPNKVAAADQAFKDKEANRIKLVVRK